MKRAADAEQARKTGGMVALMPAQEDAEHYAVPGGESVEILHCTLAYFGEDVGDLDPIEIVQALDSVASSYARIDARLFAWAMFNPDGNDGRDPCAVYLVGDTDDLTPLREDVLDAVAPLFDLPAQHEPFHAHVTAKYGGELSELQSPGEIVFDRLELHWRGDVYRFPLS